MELSDLVYDYKLLETPEFRSICLEARNIWLHDLNKYVEKHGLKEQSRKVLWSGITIPVKTKSGVVTRACIIALNNHFPDEYRYAITRTSYNARKFLLNNNIVSIFEETFTPPRSNDEQ